MSEDTTKSRDEELEVISEADRLEDEDLEEVAGGDCSTGRDGACCTGISEIGA